MYLWFTNHEYGKIKHILCNRFKQTLQKKYIYIEETKSTVVMWQTI